MAKSKIILQDSPSYQLQDGTFPIVLRLTHHRKRKYFKLKKYCHPEQWNKETSRFRKNFIKYKSENRTLLSIESKADDILYDLERQDIPFSFELFSSKFLDTEKSILVKDYISTRIEELKEEARIGTAECYKTTLNGIKSFCKETRKYNPKTIKLNDIDYTFLTSLEHWYRTKRNANDGGISVRMRDIRAIMNHAIKEKLIKRECYPFEDYQISKFNRQTKKLAIQKDDVIKIAELDFPDHSHEQFAQHIFLFSYYTRGMNFADIASLTEENIIGDRIEYRRAKTRTRVYKTISIKISSPVQEILDFYRDKKLGNSKYLIPIYDGNIHITPIQLYNRKKKVLGKVNRQLKKICNMIGMETVNLTSGVSRHTYATTLKNSDVPVSVISELMGHQDVRVTEIYLKSFEKDKLDAAEECLL